MQFAKLILKNLVDHSFSYTYIHIHASLYIKDYCKYFFFNSHFEKQKVAWFTYNKSDLIMYTFFNSIENKKLLEKKY